MADKFNFIGQIDKNLYNYKNAMFYGLKKLYNK